MKKVILLALALVISASSFAQFEKGKWILNTSVTGMNLEYNTDADKASLGVMAKGGAFLLDNVALMLQAGANWNVSGTDVDIYSLGVGGRYYLQATGIFLGASVGVDRWSLDDYHETQATLGAEAGYCFFLSRTVTIEPSAYWKLSDKTSRIGLSVGFGFYF